MNKATVISLLIAAIVSACAMNAPKKKDIDVEVITFNDPIIITVTRN